MTDFAQLRTMMVDTQIRPSDVTKFPIIDAMLSVARDAFVPADKRDLAYADLLVDLAPGRAMIEPRSLGKLLDALNIQPTDLVLVVGAGTGYGAAVAARLGQAVVALEEDADLAKEAESTLAAQGVDNAIVVSAPLTGGDPAHGPYDVILVDGAVEAMPETLLAQIKEGGRIGALFIDGAVGTARLGIKAGTGVSWRDEFNATAPVLPGFEKKQAFAL